MLWTLARQAAGDATRRLAMFYDPGSEYAGTSFLAVETNSTGSVTAADLYAVSRLSISVTNLQGRLLLNDRAAKTEALLAALRVDNELLRLLDVLLWTRGMGLSRLAVAIRTAD